MTVIFVRPCRGGETPIRVSYEPFLALRGPPEDLDQLLLSVAFAGTRRGRLARASHGRGRTHDVGPRGA